MIGGAVRDRTQGLAARSDELLEQFSLSDAADKPVKDYSGGMRRRLDLATSLLAAPLCCSSTSRPPASTRAAAPSCGTSYGTWSTTERRCC